MRITYNVKHRYAAHLKFVAKFLNSLGKLMLQTKASICPIVKKMYFWIAVSFRHLFAVVII